MPVAPNTKLTFRSQNLCTVTLTFNYTHPCWVRDIKVRVVEIPMLVAISLPSCTLIAERIYPQMLQCLQNPGSLNHEP